MTAHRPASVVAAGTAVVLLLMSGRYGYHRDELYFLQAGHHLAWGYPDQPPLTPLLARAMSALSPSSLVVLRLPSTLSAAGMVLLSGVMARELGARRSGEWLAAVATALCGFVLGTGHLLSTATTALLGTTLVCFLLLRVLHGADARWWLLIGAVGGLTMQANVFPAFILAALAAALALVGPREVFRTPWPWLAGVLAALIALPYLGWQAHHGWPQLDVARSIAAGGSGSSVSRPLFLPMEVLQVSPPLLLLWVPGLLRLLRDNRLRCFAVAFLLLQVVFLVAGGKPYYVGGPFPLLLAAGAQPFLDRVRRPAVAATAVIALSTPALVFTLPVLPLQDAGIAVAVNGDVGETIGWPRFTAQVANAYRRLPVGSAILTDNYGEAGALDRYGPRWGLPRAHSGHNGYGLWGPPPGRVDALVVGVPKSVLSTICTSVTQLGVLTSPHDIDNDENGTRLYTCRPVAPWASLWPSLRHLG